MAEDVKNSIFGDMSADSSGLADSLRSWLSDFEDKKRPYVAEYYEMGKAPGGFAGYAYAGEDSASQILHEDISRDIASGIGNDIEKRYATPNVINPLGLMNIPEGREDEIDGRYAREQFANYFDTMQHASTAAELGITEQTDPAMQDMALEGLGMYNRDSMVPVLDRMYELDQKYHFVDDEFRAYLNSLDIAGCEDLGNYRPGAFEAAEEKAAENTAGLRDGYEDSIRSLEDADKITEGELERDIARIDSKVGSNVGVHIDIDAKHPYFDYHDERALVPDDGIDYDAGIEDSIGSAGTGRGVKDFFSNVSGLFRNSGQTKEAGDPGLNPGNEPQDSKDEKGSMDVLPEDEAQKADNRASKRSYGDIAEEKFGDVVRPSDQSKEVSVEMQA